MPYKLDEDTVFDIKLCAEEAVRNAIVHGNACDKTLSVRIDFRVEGDNVVMEIGDEGGGFDYTRLPDPTEGDNVLRNSGRGVYLIKKLMDKVEFNETGNRIRMVKRLKH